MPTPTPIPFWSQSNEARSRTVAAERLVNWYLEKNTQNSKFPYALYPTPGLRPLFSVGDGPIRGMQRMREDLYVVSGNELYHVTSNYTSTLLGEIKGTGNVYMTTNDVHVLIVTERHAYAADSSSCVQIAEEYLVGAAYQDGYAIAGKLDTEQFYISDLDDLTTWTATEFSSADAIADPIVTLISLHRLLVIFGRDTIEWWTNAGIADFPFARAPGGFAEVGCIAPGSVAKAGNTVFWLGQDSETGGPQVYRARGFEAQPISTHGIARKIESLNSPQTAVAFVYSQEGHTFYVLNFDEVTMVYDLSTGLWHYRESRNQDRWRANCHAYIWKKQVVGDYSNGAVYELDLDLYVEESSFGTIEQMSAGPAGYTNVKITAHGLSAGKMIRIDGTDKYDGAYRVTSIVSADEFRIQRSFSTDEATGDVYLRTNIRREADSGPVHAGGDLATMEELWVDLEAGVGLTIEQGQDPVLLLSWSENGGRTWSNEIEMKIGKIGEYETQARVWGLGQFTERSMRIAISDPVPAHIYGAWTRMSPNPT